MTRRPTDLGSAEQDIADAIAVLRAQGYADDSPEDDALAIIECFVAVALGVMRKAKPSRIRSSALTVEIKARMDGKPGVRGCE